MKKTILNLFAGAVFIHVAATNASIHSEEKQNFYICEASLKKDGKEVMKNLITTYHPITYPSGINAMAYHYAETVASNCVYRPHHEKYNKKNVYYDTKRNSYIDICYKITNGVEEGVPGYAEFYLNRRKHIYSTNYMNLAFPLKLHGTEAQSTTLRGYTLSISCQDKMLTPIDQLWTQIKIHRDGKQ